MIERKPLTMAKHMKWARFIDCPGKSLSHQEGKGTG